MNKDYRGRSAAAALRAKTVISTAGMSMSLTYKTSVGCYNRA